MAVSHLWKFPLDLDSNTEEYPHRITFQALRSRANSTSPAPGSMVALYLPPDALKAAYTQSYGDVDMGALGVAMASVDRGTAQNLVGAAMSGAGVTEALMDLKDKTGKNIGSSLMAAAAKEGMAKMGGPAGAVVQALAKKVGVIMNPHKAMIYQGPGGFRTFSYTFTMSPQNLDETAAVKNIVTFFKWHMHPGVAGIDTQEIPVRPPESGGSRTQRSITTGGSINTSAALTYPEEFEIKMLINQSQTQKSGHPLFKIGKCVMDSFSVDYATSGGPAFFADGGEPVTTTISLGFKETVLMTKQTIAKGF